MSDQLKKLIIESAGDDAEFELKEWLEKVIGATDVHVAPKHGGCDNAGIDIGFKLDGQLYSAQVKSSWSATVKTEVEQWQKYSRNCDFFFVLGSFFDANAAAKVGEMFKLLVVNKEQFKLMYENKQLPRAKRKSSHVWRMLKHLVETGADLLSKREFWKLENRMLRGGRR